MTLDAATALVTGNQAVIRLLLEQAARDRAAGLNTAGFVSGYRGSPLAGLDTSFLAAGAALDAADIRFQPGLNEDLAATAVWGTQQIGIVPGATRDGVFGLWYGKGPGVDRSGDALKHANAAGTTRYGGVIALAGDDHVAQSSSLAHQSEFALIDASIPVFVPATLAELVDFGLYAYRLSRFAGLWTAMKVTASVIETTAVLAQPGEAMGADPPFDFPVGGPHLRWPDDPVAQEERLFAVKLPAAQAFLAAYPLGRSWMAAGDDRIGVLTIGKASLDVVAALDRLGVRQGDGVRCQALAVAWPPQPEVLRGFARGLRQIVVVEEKRSLIEDQLRSALYGLADAPAIVGKLDEAGAPLFRATLDLSLDQVTRVLGERIAAVTASATVAAALAALPPPRATPRLAARTPFFCSGCPHNRSTRVPEGSLALGGIGCHSMAMSMDRGMTAYTHMGGEGANWIGLSPFTDTRHIFQNLGDGTYFHSGALAIRAAIAAGVTITYKILFNDAVAMTGGQPVDGTLTVPILVDQLLAEGVGTIVVLSDAPGRHAGRWRGDARVRAGSRDTIDAESRALRGTPGVSVLIFDQVCAAEKRRKIKRGERPADPVRVVINERVCEGCGDCVVASNCLSVVPVDTAYGEKRRIDQASCNTDLGCLNGFCPSLVSVTGTPRKARAGARPLPDIALPEPAIPPLDQPFRILACGTGGTGVVTLGAMLATAAQAAGLGATVLDATGMAQKGGSVWSHVTLLPTPGGASVARIPDRAADTLIGCDLVVAASPPTLATIGDATRAVVNLDAGPTGGQVLDPRLSLPHAALRAQIADVVPGAAFTRAADLAARYAGDPVSANLVMLGHAWQAGWVPLPLACIEAAIAQGRGADANRAAFRCGRIAAVDPAALDGAPPPDRSIERAIALAGRDEAAPAIAGSAPAAPQPPALADRLADELFRYGGAKPVARFRALVGRVPAGHPDLAEAVAHGAFKLLAIKDEWEVARLFTDGDFRRALAQEFAGPARIRYHFAPPWLGREGERPAKRSFGAWLTPVLWTMARLRWLRGTPFDSFARTAERRAERALVDWYETLIDRALADLGAATLPTALALARLPTAIRGYGAVRHRTMIAARAEADRLLATLDEPARAAA